MTVQAAQDALERGDRAEAHRILLEILENDPRNEAALTLMLQAAENDQERRRYARLIVMTVNPQHAEAQRILQTDPPAAGAPASGRGVAQDVAQDVLGGLVGGFLRSRGVPISPGTTPFGGPQTFAFGAKPSPIGQQGGEEGVYEMLWDCKFCGTTKLLGKTHRFCPNCGAAQDPAARYFPSDEDKVAVHEHVYVGADLICPACSTLNAGNAKFCQNCGSPLDNAQAASTLGQRAAASGQAFVSSGSRDIVKEQFDTEQARIAAEEQARKWRQRRPYIIGGVGVAVIALIALFVWLLTPNAAQISVSGHHWERTIGIQEYTALREGSWDESVPGDSYSRSCYERQRGSRQVDTGQRECTSVQIDNGDGTFRQEQQCRPIYRDEPVYDTWCDYTVDRWIDITPAVTRGTSLEDTPRWAEVRLNTCSGTRLGCQRESGRVEAYTVEFTDTNSSANYECTFDSESLWRSYSLNSSWDAQVRRLGGLDCDSVQRP